MSEGTVKSVHSQHVCIVNVGLFHSETLMLAEAAKKLELEVYSECPNLTRLQHRGFLYTPDELVRAWFSKSGGFDEIIGLAAKFDIICNGWMTLLVFLQPAELERLKEEARCSGIHLQFIASTREIESTMMSELNHWIVHDLEHKAGLSPPERERLEDSLRDRAREHQHQVRHLCELGFLQLMPLADIHGRRFEALSRITNLSEVKWANAFSETRIVNVNPSLPVEGVLLTLRLGTGEEAHKKIASVKRLLREIEQDSLCRYLVVLAIDADEIGHEATDKLICHLKSRVGQKGKLQAFHLVKNPPRDDSARPFAICSVWNEMALVAWKNGADWVILLGDDIEVKCRNHYRFFYRRFFDISKRLGVPFGFGCPWWNDVTFPGFPSFICVGKTHLEIFGGLIPQHRNSTFINQDLDPYIQRMYDKFLAADCVLEAVLTNGTGGHIGFSEARYKRFPAVGWRDFVRDDAEPIREYLLDKNSKIEEAILLDVVVPSYRVNLDYLSSICSLRVPSYMRTIFIIIVDNTEALVRAAAEVFQKSGLTFDQSEIILENFLSQDGNTIRVRYNTSNVGASASRNRGIDESAADWVLNLDDDLKANPDLLEQYGRKLLEITSDREVFGLIGLVRFPRSPTLPLRHAAVLMSYLTFMFEIAEKDMYKDGPAWGVTANILFRRTRIRFDLAYLCKDRRR